MVKPSERENMMKEFKTISELEILYNAWLHLLSKWTKESERKREKESANPNTDISKARCERLMSQIDEVHERILELEREAQK